ncbi:hypothetical protein ZOSMA_189G00600 [Zostera marina]|uniref:Uncharacterized protein n=1 Tax=Zostera marina TaxID=29655 RepID=A0A0K9PPX9_ZOSMR|nr:hypothetical protein ZOSMA_189G00600 [Zostera marina]
MNLGASTSEEVRPNLTDMELEETKWDDVICPICLEFPHNCVLLKCSSHSKGCRPFLCDTDQTHSNCLDRYKENTEPICPLCRGRVTGWVAVGEARLHLDNKTRSCEEKTCTYIGNYMGLQKHARLEHPNARPAEIDPARKLDWENFQQSSEIIDVLSTVQSEMPRGVILGDYVIEYGNDYDNDDDDDNDNAREDDYQDFPGDEGNWWTSSILYHVFDNFRASRNRRRARAAEVRRQRQRWSIYDQESSPTIDVAEYRFDDTDDEFIGTGVLASTARGNPNYRSSSRRQRLASMANRRFC